MNKDVNSLFFFILVEDSNYLPNSNLTSLIEPTSKSSLKPHPIQITTPLMGSMNFDNCCRKFLSKF